MEWHGDVALTLSAAAFVAAGTHQSAAVALGGLAFHLLILGRRRVALVPAYGAVLSTCSAVIAFMDPLSIPAWLLWARAGVGASLALGFLLDTFVLRLRSPLPEPAPGVGLLLLNVRAHGAACALRIYYPAVPSRAARLIPYSLHGAAMGRGVATFMSMPGAVFAWLQHVRGWCVEGAPDTAPVRDNGTPLLPVVVFSHGLAGTPDMYSAVISHLTSLGYVVFAPEHADGSAAFTRIPVDAMSASDAAVSAVGLSYVRLLERERTDRGLEYARRHRQLKQRTSEACAALRIAEDLARSRVPGHAGEALDMRLARAVLGARLDLRNGAIAMGHSFGAATAIACAERDSCVSGVIAHDTWAFPLSSTTISRGVARVPIVTIMGQGFSRWAENVIALQLLLDPPARAAAAANAAKGTGVGGVGGAAASPTAPRSVEEGSTAEDISESNGVDKVGRVDPRWAPATPARGDAGGIHPGSGQILLRDIWHQSFSDFGLLAPAILRHMKMIGSTRSAEDEVILIRDITAAALRHVDTWRVGGKGGVPFVAERVVGVELSKHLLRADECKLREGRR